MSSAEAKKVVATALDERTFAAVERVMVEDGKMVQRAGWNGKGMHVYLEDGYELPIKGGVFAGTTRRYDPVIVMYTAQGTHQPGWLASQADMLADDWNVVTST